MNVKRLLLTGLFLAIFGALNSGNMPNIKGLQKEWADGFILREDQHKQQVLIQHLVDAIIHVESRGKVFAYNRSEGAAGVMQIRPIMVREANRLVGYKKYKYSDRWDKDKSIAMFLDVQLHANPEWDFEKACRLWNGGYGWQYKPSTIIYWNKVKEEFLNGVLKTSGREG